MKINNAIQAAEAVSIVEGCLEGVAQEILTNLMTAIRTEAGQAKTSYTPKIHDNMQVVAIVADELRKLGYTVESRLDSFLSISWRK